MRTTETEKQMSQLNGNVSSQTQVSSFSIPESNGVRGMDRIDATPVADERLAVMAAIAKEVAEQSEAYSTELETELHRLNAENQALRELLAIQNNSASSMTTSAGSNTVVSSRAGAKDANGSNSPKPVTDSSDDWSGTPIVFK